MQRGSGILLHITSLPSPFGLGDLGPGAYNFVDFLDRAQQSFWQILPLSPTDIAHGNSPYHSSSAFAGNPWLISPELLEKDGWIDLHDFGPLPDFPKDRTDYSRAIALKTSFFDRVCQLFKSDQAQKDEFALFCGHHGHWLNDYALFTALKSHFAGKVWNEWPPEFRDRQPEALRWAERDLAETVNKVKLLQFLFFRQWFSLKTYCNEKGIQIIGDLPIYVTFDSADVWRHPDLFKLGPDKKPEVLAGVPPDYFSRTGQLWGNPVYRWDVLQERKFDWWLQRIKHKLALYDLVRIDHFRGLVAYWEVPASEETAINGKWQEAPTAELFKAIYRRFPFAPLIAEDLGTITPDVREIMRQFNLPGMKVLLFAFDPTMPENPYAPHHHVPECFLYTGTHDNNTVRGWFEQEADPETKARLFSYLGREVGLEEVHWEFIRLAMMSVAKAVILPIQDLLGLGEEARMNLPGRKDGNWTWRLTPESLTPGLADRLLNLTKIYGRA